MRIKNSKDFYLLLHELELEDPLWYQHVGAESKLNVYLDDGDLDTDQATIIANRKRLKRLREMIEVENSFRMWRTPGRRAAMRLIVTYYHNFGLKTKEISQLLKIPASTIRHDYPPLKEGELLDPGYKLALHDKYGRRLDVREL